ncbi:acyl-CoA thioesterase [Serratia sp. OS31]|uniref:acyl-CoA thioesterase n=1 Tax=Serratia sp. OS31 TaxID=2760844 RepID=UPI00210409B2|nr:acyl-CoA thioesterase [Serratia sp. OS31]
MNLYLRLLWILISSCWKPRMSMDALTSSLQTRVWLNDIDINLHMNNGRYLTVCDLNRVDMFIRTGLMKLMLKRRWSPIVSQLSMDYKKALQPFQRYQVSMTITHWDDRYFYATHTFSVGDRIVALGTSQAVVLGKEGVVAPEEVVKSVQQYQQAKESKPTAPQ